MAKKQPRPPFFMYAEKSCTCAETGGLIRKGDKIAYYPSTRSSYANNSKQAQELREQHFASAYNMADANY